MVMRIILILAVVLSVAACQNEETTTMDSTQFSDLLKMREEKDNYFRNDPQSPIPLEEREGFEGLNYYAPDSAYIVNARFEAAASADTFLMQTTSDDIRKTVKAGTFIFTINGQEGRLAAYQFVGKEHSSYFVPFKDATNRSETYPTGRYLDIDIAADNSYVLDFNLAYNPYCAYNENYSCPLVPAENELPFAIKAGERSWH